MADHPLDELDRLQRGTGPDTGIGAPARRSIWPWAIAGLLFTFLLGMLASPWFERSIRGRIPGAVAQEAIVDPRVDGLADRIAALEAVQPSPSRPDAIPEAALTRRIEALEAFANSDRAGETGQQARLEALAADLARTSSAIAEGDARMRDLFLIGIVRRMLDAGRPLTPLLPVLKSRFAAQNAAAVEALEAWTAVPQTRNSLRTRLDPLEARIIEEAGAGNWWDRLKARLSGLVTVRGAEKPATADPADVLAEARAGLESGDLSHAATLMSGLSASPGAREWAADARVLLAAEDAMQQLESKALEQALADAARGPATAPAPVNAPSVNASSSP